MWPKQTFELIRHLNLSMFAVVVDVCLFYFVFNQEKEGFGPGHDERLNLSSI